MGELPDKPPGGELWLQSDSNTPRAIRNDKRLIWLNDPHSGKYIVTVNKPVGAWVHIQRNWSACRAMQYNQIRSPLGDGCVPCHNEATRA